MFCDLVGSTALSARLDPEDLREVIGAYHRCCADLITEAGGFVAKYMGDGVLAALNPGSAFAVGLPITCALQHEWIRVLPPHRRTGPVMSPDGVCGSKWDWQY